MSATAKSIVLGMLLLLGGLSAAGGAYAQAPGGGAGGGPAGGGGGVTPPSIIRSGIDGCDFTTGRLSASCIPNFIASVVIFIYGLVGVFFMLNIMYAGYQIAFAGAGIMDEGAGKQRLKWAIIGFIMTVCSFLILSAIVSVFSRPFTPAP